MRIRYTWVCRVTPACPAMDGKDVGPPGRHDGSIVASLDPHRPVLFGCRRRANATGQGPESAKFVSRGRVLASDGFIVYDVQDESSRTAEERPFPFRTLWDSSWYAGIVTSESNKQCVVYKAAPCDAGFSDWLRDCVEKDGHSALTIVGAPSSKQKHPGPSTKDACKLTAAVPGVHFGCVCIAERHVKNRCEHEILIKKMQWGAEWFITRHIRPPTYDRRHQRLLRSCTGKAQAKKDSSPFTPWEEEEPWPSSSGWGCEFQIMSSREYLEFGSDCAKRQRGEQERFRWQHHGNGDLRATVSPKTKKTRKKLRVKTPVEISCEIMCENLRTILDETRTCGVPLGINVESVSGYRDEIDATHDLFRSLQSIMLNHQGVPWVVRWHALELSDRRRQLSLPRPETGRVQSSHGLVHSSDGVRSLLLGVAVGAAAVGLGFFLGCRNKA